MDAWRPTHLAALAATLASGLILTTSAHAARTAIDAERMGGLPEAGKIVRDTEARGRVALLTVPRPITGRLVAKAGDRLTLSLRRAGCGARPRVVALVDGVRVLDVTIRRGGWRTVSARVPAGGGTHRVSVRLVNAGAKSCAQAVRVDRVFFTQPLVAPATAAAATVGTGGEGVATTTAGGTSNPGSVTTTGPAGGSKNGGSTTGGGTATGGGTTTGGGTGTGGGTSSGGTTGGTTPAGVWRPAQRASFQWQLTGALDTTVAAQVFDVDMETTTAAQVAALHAAGAKVVCYISAGSYEQYRSDAASFPAAALGNTLDGWPDERWLDVRRIDLIGPIMERRLDQCRAKGFDAVEYDNVDGYTNATGFPLTGADQLAYNRFLARAAHARGLAAALKNDLDQMVALEPDFDFAVVEQCFQYSECEMTQPFLRAGKAVFVTEYSLATTKFCAQANAMGIMAMRKRLALDAYREVCW